MHDDENKGVDCTMAGLITEGHFVAAEAEFPGIAGFYASCVPRPRTFLELLTRFGAFSLCCVPEGA